MAKRSQKYLYLLVADGIRCGDYHAHVICAKTEAHARGIAKSWARFDPERWMAKSTRCTLVGVAVDGVTSFGPLLSDCVASDW